MRKPSFLLSPDGPAREESGEVYGGTLAWSGSFQLAFEVDWANRLRALCGINPFGSEYRLARGRLFKTPAVLWTWSGEGKGRVSRNFHRWARRYGIRDGDRPRPVLLNNWGGRAERHRHVPQGSGGVVLIPAGDRASVVAAGRQHADLPFKSDFRPGETRSCIVLNGAGSRSTTSVSR
jgi:hypothetical protein